MDKKLEERLDRIEGQLAVPQRIVSMPVDLSQTVPSLEGYTVAENCPITGNAYQLLLGFPDGCKDLVEVSIYYAGEQIWPIKGSIALNNASPVIDIKRPVKKGGEFRAVIDNYDGANEHHITVVVMTEGIE